MPAPVLQPRRPRHDRPLAVRAATGLLLSLALFAPACQLVAGMNDLELQLRDGGDCASDEVCFSGSCVDGICCQSACEAECMACNVSGSEGQCSPIPRRGDPDEECGEDLACNGLGACQARMGWAVVIARVGLDEALAAISVDPSGNLALAADWYQGSGIDTDGAVTKLDDHGNIAWQASFGDAYRQTTRQVAHSEDGDLFLIGQFEGTIDLSPPPFSASTPPLVAAVTNPAAGELACAYVVKLRGHGSHVWSRAFGADASKVLFAGAAAIDRSLDPAAGVVLVGSLAGTVDYGLGPTSSTGDDDALVARLDADGNTLWVLVAGDEARQRVSVVASDRSASSDRVVVAGSYEGTIDLGSGALPAPGPGQSDLFVGTLDLAGNAIWSRRLEAHGEANLSAAVLAPDHTSIVAGTLNGTLDLGAGTPLAGDGGAFVVRFDANGVPLWSQQYLATGSIRITGLALDPLTGEAFLGGYAAGTVDLGGGPFAADGTDAFVARVDTAGNLVWSRHFSGSGNEYGVVVGLDQTGHLRLAGDFTDELQVGDVALDGSGGRDLFALQLDAD